MDHPPRILVVDDDAIVADSIADFLESVGFEACAALDGPAALEILDRAAHAEGRPVAVLICDMTLPGMDGLELIGIARDQHPGVVPIAITGYGRIEAAVRSIRIGAIDYLTKPLMDDELRLVVERAVQQHTLLDENAALKQQLDQRYGLDSIVGADPRMRKVYEIIEAVAPGKTTVLMSGESGTGKSLIARAIHRRSERAGRPFVEIACGSIPETLLESELFGHVQGAFTSAHADKPGRFLAAHEGTIFLDEINSASPGMQLKLLRVLQEKQFEPVGSNETVSIDVRVILASNQPLEALVADGRFRQDLYYRINVVRIELPPLRERVADIPLLAEHFLQQKAADLGKSIAGFEQDALDALRRYAFPGNVRELENIVERAVVLTRANRIALADLPDAVASGAAGPLVRSVLGDGHDPAPPDDQYQPIPLRDALAEPERRIILAALRANGWNRQRTAEVLEINRTTLYKKMKQFGLDELSEAG